MLIITITHIYYRPGYIYIYISEGDKANKSDMLPPFTNTCSGFVYLTSRGKAAPQWSQRKSHPQGHSNLCSKLCFLSGGHVLPVVFLASMSEQVLQNVPNHLQKLPDEVTPLWGKSAPRSV